MMRATYMRVLKFFLFPITHKSMFGKPENKGSPMTKAAAAAVASLPEGFTIQPLEVAKIALQLVRKYLKKSMSRHAHFSCMALAFVSVFMQDRGATSEGYM